MQIYDGPNKIKKRWAIGLFALAGLLQTVSNVPQWVHEGLAFLAGVI